MSPRFEKPLRLIDLVIGLVMIVGGGLVTAGMAWANVTNDIATLKSSFAEMRENQKAITRIETDVSEIKTDIRWLRERSEK